MEDGIRLPADLLSVKIPDQFISVPLKAVDVKLLGQIGPFDPYVPVKSS